MSRRPFLAVLLALLLLPLPGAPLRAGQESSPARSEAERGQAEGERAQESLLSWTELLERNERLAFTRLSGKEARRAAAAGELDEEERAAAVMAVGCTEPQPVRERPWLEGLARGGSELERRAAVLALGEFGEGAEAVLEELLEDPDPLLRGCAQLALLRTGRPAGRREVELVAAQGGEAGRQASELLVLVGDPAGSRPNEIAELWLDLRWRAARRYGLVDGASWSTRLLEGLLGDPRFLEAVILGSVADSTVHGVKDFLLSRLVEKAGPNEMRAAVVSMPDEIASMVEAGLWQPDPRHWQLLLEEIDRQHNEDDSLALLSLALDVPAVEVHALLLIARAGLPEPLLGLEEQWPDLSPRERRLALEAWALVGDSEALGFMKEFEDEPDPEVRAWMLVARARLGDLASHAEMKERLLDFEHEEHAATLQAVLEQSEAPLAQTYLEQLLEVATGEEHLRVARALAEAGVARGRAALAEDVAGGFPPGMEGARCVRALTGRDASTQIDLLREHFPVENDLVLNIALALAIVEAEDDLALRYVRHALWNSPFDMSVLAGLVIVRMQGLYGLRDELNRAPVDATVEDLRRVGFALGTWGGIAEVDDLVRRQGLLPKSPVLQGALLGALGRRTH